MNKKLQNSIVYILSKQGENRMGVMRLAKYLYLADYVYAKSFGKKKGFTGTYSRLEYGPVPEDFYPVLKGLYKDGTVLRTGNILSLEKTPNSIDLSEEEKACIDWITEHFAQDTLEKVKNAAYKTEPMLKIQELEVAIGGEKLIMEDLDFSSVQPHSLVEDDIDTGFLDSEEYLDAVHAS